MSSPEEVRELEELAEKEVALEEQRQRETREQYHRRSAAARSTRKRRREEKEGEREAHSNCLPLFTV